MPDVQAIHSCWVSISNQGFKNGLFVKKISTLSKTFWVASKKFLVFSDRWRLKKEKKASDTLHYLFSQYFDFSFLSSTSSSSSSLLSSAPEPGLTGATVQTGPKGAQETVFCLLHIASAKIERESACVSLYSEGESERENPRFFKHFRFLLNQKISRIIHFWVSFKPSLAQFFSLTCG